MNTCSARTANQDYGDCQIKSLRQEDVMHGSKEFRFRTLLTLALVLAVCTVMAAQSENANPTTESLRNSPLERRLAQILPHAGQGAASNKTTQPPTTRLDRTSFGRSSRDEARHADLADSQRPAGAAVAAERYVFGRMDLATGSEPYAVAIGAFQSGGPQSIAVANPGSDTVSVLLANPDGTFQAKTDYATDPGPNAIAIGDFNGDHNLDLAVSNYDGTISILLGNGDGTFKPAVSYSCIETCTDVVVGDFNGDGKLDLAVDAFDAHEVAILLGNGDGTFQTSVGYATGDGP